MAFNSDDWEGKRYYGQGSLREWWFGIACFTKFILTSCIVSKLIHNASSHPTLTFYYQSLGPTLSVESIKIESNLVS